MKILSSGADKGEVKRKRLLILFLGFVVGAGIFFWLDPLSETFELGLLKRGYRKSFKAQSEKEREPAEIQKVEEWGGHLSTSLRKRKKSSVPAGFSNLRDFVERGLRNPETADQEKGFEQNGRQLLVLPGVVALEPNGQSSGNPSPEGFQHLGFSVVKTDKRQILEKGFPVVYDAYAGSLGVVTGNIGIKYQPNARSDRFASRYQIQLAQDHPDITFAFFSTRLKNVDQLLELVETVKGDPEVEYATLDLIESAAQAH